MRYLDPRNDLTFRKIFGGHKDLCISLLNALLPLPDDEQIVSIEYDDPTMFPRTQDGKTSIVDVSCRGLACIANSRVISALSPSGRGRGVPRPYKDCVHLPLS